MTGPIKTEVMTHMTAAPITKEAATERGLVPPHHVWNERLQQAVPLGMALEREQLERPMDLQRNLEEWDANRKTLVKFIADRMQEAEYKEDKYPISGRMHDYYILPNYDKKTLTKLGAEKLGDLFKLRRGSTETVERVVTKEFAMAVVRVMLVDQYRRPAGSGEAACSTAEAGFQSARTKKKYGDDYRAAINDLIARAGKRAFVQAIIYAIAGDELFEANEGEDDEDAKKEKAQTTAGACLPKAKALKQYAGKPLAEISTEDLTKIATTLRTKTKNPAAWTAVLEQLDLELDQRTQASLDEESDDLPL